jgi:ubiquitin related modifier 1
MFEGKKKIELELENTDAGLGAEWNLERLIDELRRQHLKDKEEMFVQGRSVRPGIIVLVNDTDWELLETTRYKL